MSTPEHDEDLFDSEGSDISEETAEAVTDVLAEVCTRAGLGDDALETLTAWMLHELEGDQFTRLEQAGHSVEERIPLAKVFVDLVVSDAPGAGGWDVEDEDDMEYPPPLDADAQIEMAQVVGHEVSVYGFTRYLCQPRKTRRKRMRTARSRMHADDSPEVVEGHVLIGGPGQGKSTLGQLLCQLHRGYLLRPRLHRATSSAQRAAVEAFTSPAARRELGKPAEQLLPVRIVLAEAAAWLTQTPEIGSSEIPRLLHHVADRARQHGHEIMPEHLLAILGEHDWLLVLDGLDEVPGSRDRERVLVAMRELLACLSRQRFGLVVATTRPQGYTGEFDDLGVCVHSSSLIPLSKRRALAYARRLVDARFPPHRRQTVLDRLTMAANGESTARLMSSPLQVTILATLVDRIGRAPNERWTLFKEYYRVVYEREMERPIKAAELLRDYRGHIDKIHAQVGLLLHVETETAGGTGSVMSPERFRHIVDAVLAEDEIDGARRAALVEQIGKVVEERLVLLVTVRQRELGFEIRSIQEFMAAWALSQKDEATVEARLRQIAKASSFRNVVLFLASKAFTELSDLREALTDRICPGLNDDPDDPVAQALQAGSMLALDILEEGSALKQAKYVKRLVLLATRLLDQPPSSLMSRIVRSCLADTDAAEVARPLLHAAIEERLAADGPKLPLGAWHALVTLINEGDSRARAVADACWERHETHRRAILDTLIWPGKEGGAWLGTKVLEHLPELSPWLVSDFVRRSEFPERLETILSLVSHRHVRPLRISHHGQEFPLLLSITPVKKTYGTDWTVLANMPDPPADWLSWVAAARFREAPSAQRLSEVLDYIADRYDAALMQGWHISHAPWPLAACLHAASCAGDLRHLSRRVAAGELGDIEDWLAEQTRWIPSEPADEQTIELADLFEQSLEYWPYQPGRFPLAAAHCLGYWRARSRAPLHPAPALLTALQVLHDMFLAQAPSSPLRRVLADWIMTRIKGIGLGNPEEPLDGFGPDELEAIWSATPDSPIPVLLILRATQPWRSTNPGWTDLLDRYGRTDRLFAGVPRAPHFAQQIARYISQLFTEDPTRPGLLHILALCAMSGIGPEIDTEQLRALTLEDERARHDVWLLCLARGELLPIDASSMVAIGHGYLQPSSWPVGEALQILSWRPPDDPTRELALLTLSQTVPRSAWRLHAHIGDQLAEVLASRPSGLVDPATWTRLRLPLPYPERGHLAAESRAVENRPVRIESIALENIRIFDEFLLEPAQPENGSGQWIVILGENGIGKSSLLRSLVLALLDVTSQPNRLPRSSFAQPWRRRGTSDHEKGTIRVSLYQRVYVAELAIAQAGEHDKERFTQEVRSPGSQAAQAYGFPLFAYGCRRGSALGGARRTVEDNPGAEVYTLFDEGADLIHAETWLLLREHAALKEESNPQARLLYRTVIEALKTVLCVDDIYSRDQQIWVRGAEVGDVPLAALSDGYLTTMGWVIDLIARWVKRTELHREPITEDFARTMTGLVLVDEIDLHLHPAWQSHVIADLRTVFPRMSFIVTTHNPLTLLGAEAHEIWRLKRAQDGRVVAEQGCEKPALMTGSDIYNLYFDIRSLFPSQLGDMLNRYGDLASNPMRTVAEDAEAQRLLAELRANDIDPGWEPVSREPAGTISGDEQA